MNEFIHYLETCDAKNTHYVKRFLNYVRLWERIPRLTTIVMGDSPYFDDIYPYYGSAFSYESDRVQWSVDILATSLGITHGLKRDDVIFTFKHSWLLLMEGIIFSNALIKAGDKSITRRHDDVEFQSRALCELITTIPIADRLDIVAMGEDAKRTMSELTKYIDKFVPVNNVSSKHPAYYTPDRHGIPANWKGLDMKASKVLAKLVNTCVDIRNRCSIFDEFNIKMTTKNPFADVMNHIDATKREVNEKVRDIISKCVSEEAKTVGTEISMIYSGVLTRIFGMCDQVIESQSKGTAKRANAMASSTGEIQQPVTISTSTITTPKRVGVPLKPKSDTKQTSSPSLASPPTSSTPASSPPTPTSNPVFTPPMTPNPSQTSTGAPSSASGSGTMQKSGSKILRRATPSLNLSSPSLNKVLASTSIHDAVTSSPQVSSSQSVSVSQPVSSNIDASIADEVKTLDDMIITIATVKAFLKKRAQEYTRKGIIDFSAVLTKPSSDIIRKILEISTRYEYEEIEDSIVRFKNTPVTKELHMFESLRNTSI